MPTLCSGCGRPPLSRTAQRCTYCGGSLINTPAVAPASALDPKRAGQEADLPFPEEATPTQAVASAEPDLFAPGPGAAPAPEAPSLPPPPPPGATAGRAKAGWDSVSPAVARPSTPRRPTAKLSPEARAILEAKEPALWQQVIMAPFASRPRKIALFVVAIIVVSILGLNSVIESSKPPETARGPVLDTRPGGGLVAVPPDAPAVIPGAVQPPAALRGAEASLGRIADALKKYADLKSGLPERLSEDLHELHEIGDFSGELVHFAPGSFRYKHFSRIDLSSDSAEISAAPRNGADPLVIKIDWVRKARASAGGFGR